MTGTYDVMVYISENMAKESLHRVGEVGVREIRETPFESPPPSFGPSSALVCCSACPLDENKLSKFQHQGPRKMRFCDGDCGLCASKMLFGSSVPSFKLSPNTISVCIKLICNEFSVNGNFFSPLLCNHSFTNSVTVCVALETNQSVKKHCCC